MRVLPAVCCREKPPWRGPGAPESPREGLKLCPPPCQAAWQETPMGIESPGLPTGGLCPGPCGSPPTPSSPANQGLSPSCPPTLLSLRSRSRSRLAAPKQGPSGWRRHVSAGIQALVVRSHRSPSPSPQIHPPTPFPTAPGLLGGSTWRRESEQRPAPWAGGVGGLTHSVPSPVPMGQPSRPWARAPGQAPGFRKRKLPPRGLTRAG